MSQSLGRRLKQIRESKGISLEEIAQQTRIRMEYLQAIEIDDIEALPSRTHLRGFLRLYAHVLGVEIAELQVQPDQIASEDTAPAPEAKSTPEISEVKPEQEAPQSTPPVIDEPIIKQEQFKPATEPEFPEEITHTPKTTVKETSDMIFSGIGERLRARRELLSLSLEDIHKMLFVRKEYLEALEDGDLDRLPSPVQAKGMLNNYAEFLNLDLDAVMLRFADGLQLRRLEKQKTPPKNQDSARQLSPTRLRLKNFFSIDLLVIAGLFIGFAIFVIWGVNRIFTVDSLNSEATDLPEVSDILLATTSPTPALTPSPGEEQLEETPIQEATEEIPILFTPAAFDSPINILIVPRQQTWVQITIDAEIAFEGRLLPGNAYDFSGEESLEIRTGNAGALQIYFNDQDIGSAGLFGQVVDLIFTSNGLVLPTPTNKPTITQTPEATATPTVTPTQSPTITETNDQTSE